MLENRAFCSWCRWRHWFLSREEHWSRDCAQSDQWCTAEGEAVSTLQESEIFSDDGRSSGTEEEQVVLSFSLKLGMNRTASWQQCLPCLCKYLWAYLLQNEWKRDSTNSKSPEEVMMAHMSSLGTTRGAAWKWWTVSPFPCPVAHGSNLVQVHRLSLPHLCPLLPTLQLFGWCLCYWTQPVEGVLQLATY